MKKIFILGATIALAMGTSSFAAEAIQGKLISHKEIIPQGIVASFKTVNLKGPRGFAQSNKLMNDKLGGRDSVWMRNKAYDTYGFVGDELTFTASSDVSLYNFTQTTHTYTVQSSVCADIDQFCVSNVDTYSLVPNSYLSLGISPSRTFTSTEAAGIQVWVQTVVNRDDGETSYASGDVANISFYTPTPNSK